MDYHNQNKSAGKRTIPSTKISKKKVIADQATNGSSTVTTGRAAPNKCKSQAATCSKSL